MRRLYSTLLTHRRRGRQAHSATSSEARTHGTSVVMLSISLLALAAAVGWLLILLNAGPTYAAAVKLDTSIISSQTGCDPCTWSHTVTGDGSDRAIVVVVTHTPGSIVGVTYGTGDLTEARTDTNGVAAETSIWYLVNPTTGVNTVSVDFGAAASRAIMISYSFLNVDQTTPIDSSTGDAATSTTSTVDITTTADNTWIVDASRAASGHTMVAHTNRVERLNISAGGKTGASSTVGGTGSGVTTMDWTMGNKAWSLSAISLTPFVLQVSTSDTAVLSESITAALGVPRTDTSSLGESVLAALAGVQSDTSSLAESILAALSAARTDAASLLESAATGIVPTDTSTLGESVAAALGVSPSDIAGLGDSAKAALSIARTEISTLSEFTQSVLGKSETQVSSLGESVAAALGVSRSDTSSLAESILTVLSAAPSDIASLLEAAATGILPTDTSSLGESVAAALGVSRSDIAGLGDSVLTALSAAPSDVASLLEAVATGIPPKDTSSLGESVASAFGVSRSDIAGLGDSANAALSITRT